MSMLTSFDLIRIAGLIGMTLLHFLWQGALGALLLACALMLIGKSRAAMRYSAACSALLIMSLLPFATAAYLESRVPPTATKVIALHSASPIPPTDMPAETNTAIKPIAGAVPDGPDAHPPMPNFINIPIPVTVFGIWMVGVLVMSLRLLGGWMVVCRLLRCSTTPGDALNRIVVSLSRRAGLGRPPRLLVCDRITVPAVIGGLRAAILLPAGAVSGVSTDLLEALIAHELCHLKRHDYLVNLWQSGVETLLFYHPAVWWVSGIIRREREFCCDDMAVALLNNRVTYATALAALEEMRSRPLALAASDGDLLARIRRIASPAPRGQGGPSAAVLTLAVPVVIALALFVTFVRPATPANAAANPPAGRAAIKSPTDTLSSLPTAVNQPRVNDSASATITDFLLTTSRAADHAFTLAPLFDQAKTPSLVQATTPNTTRAFATTMPVPNALSPLFPGLISASSSPTAPIENSVPSPIAMIMPSAQRFGIGFPTSATEADSGPGPLNLLIGSPLKRSAPEVPADAQTIGEIDVVGNKLLSKDAIIKLSGHKIGDPCTTEVLEDMSMRLTMSGNFGMHHPGNLAHWVRMEVHDVQQNKRKITITVDENDKVTTIKISWNGPADFKAPKVRLTSTPVFNTRQFESDKQNIQALCSKMGYVADFGNDVGMDLLDPGTLNLRIRIARVANITVLREGVALEDVSLFRGWKTKIGDFFAVADFEQDVRRLDVRGYGVAKSEWRVTEPGLVALTINLKSKTNSPASASSDKAGANVGPTIGKINVVGNKVLNTPAIIALSGHKVGDPCTPEILADMQQKLAKSGYFGMHHPDKPAQWVRVQSEDAGENKCKVTITVDENDQITGITITGAGPVRLDVVKVCLTRTAVFNPQQFEKDKQYIGIPYNQLGYSIEFGADTGVDPATPGLLVVSIIITRVDEIIVTKDGARVDDPQLLREIGTKVGEYYSRRTFYEVDRAKLIKNYPGNDVIMTERPAGKGRIRLTISLKRLTKEDR